MDGTSLRGKGLAELVAVLKGHAGDRVDVCVRRHRYKGVEL